MLLRAPPPAGDAVPRQYVYVPTQAVPQSNLLAAMAGGFTPVDAGVALANNRMTERILPQWRRNVLPGRKQQTHHHHNIVHKKHPAVIKGTALTRRPAVMKYMPPQQPRQQQPAAAPLMVNVPPSPNRTPRSPPRSDKPSRQRQSRQRSPHSVHGGRGNGFPFLAAPGNQDDDGADIPALAGADRDLSMCIGSNNASMSTLPLSQLQSTNDLVGATLLEQTRAHAVVSQLLAEPGADWVRDADGLLNATDNAGGVESDHNDRGDSTVDLGGRGKKGPPTALAAKSRPTKVIGLSKLAEAETEGDEEEDDDEKEEKECVVKGGPAVASPTLDAVALEVPLFSRPSRE